MIYYVVMLLRPWSSLGIQAIGHTESPHTGRDATLPGHGFMPVFKTRAEAVEFAGGEYRVTAVLMTKGGE